MLCLFRFDLFLDKFCGIWSISSLQSNRTPCPESLLHSGSVQLGVDRIILCICKSSSFIPFSLFRVYTKANSRPLCITNINACSIFQNHRTHPVFWKSCIRVPFLLIYPLYLLVSLLSKYNLFRMPIVTPGSDEPGVIFSMYVPTLSRLPEENGGRVLVWTSRLPWVSEIAFGQFPQNQASFLFGWSIAQTFLPGYNTPSKQIQGSL